MAKSAKSLVSLVRDGWFNILTGLGMSIDKTSGADFNFDWMPEADCEALYACDDLAARIVDLLPQDAMREWITLTMDQDLASRVDQGLSALAVGAKFTQALKWARLYGGSAILMVVDDSRDLSQPLDPRAVRSVLALTVLSRYEIWPKTIDDDVLSPNFGKPLVYVLNPRRGTVPELGKEIHYSRLIRFDGAPLPMRLNIANRYWGDSVLNRIQDKIRNFALVHGSLATVLQEFNQGVIKLKGLRDSVAAGQDQAIQKRLQIAQAGRGIVRALVLDADDEEFTNQGATLAGVGDLVDRVAQRLVIASGMPHTLILGDSPSGLGATGESEKTDWYDYVASFQEEVIRPRLKLLIELLMMSRTGPTRGQVPADWSFDFRPLWQMDDEQTVNLRKAQAEADQIYIETGVLDPAEVALARFGGAKYSFETTIDADSRKSPPADSPVVVPPSSTPAAPQAPAASAKPQPEAGDGV